MIFCGIRVFIGSPFYLCSPSNVCTILSGDRHYFLSQYFRNNYDKALETFPYINSRVQINRIEVWITNKQNRVNSTENNLRNIVALQDLGEAPLTGVLPQETVHINLTSHPNF